MVLGVLIGAVILLTVGVWVYYFKISADFRKEQRRRQAEIRRRRKEGVESE